MRDKVEEYIEIWEGRGYPEGIPDEVPSCLERLNKAPSYKAVCLAILRNDHSMQCLGFSPKVCGSYKALKRIELERRNEEIQSKQERI